MAPSLRMELTVGGSAKPLKNLQPILFTMEHRVNAIPSATVLLSTVGNSMHDLGRDSETMLCRPGADVAVFFDSPQGRATSPAFTGVIVAQDLELKRGTAAVLTLKLRHSLARLESGCRSMVYADMSPASIIDKLLGPLKIANSNTAGMDTKREQCIQFQCSDWRYIRSLLDTHCAWLIPGPQRVEVIKPRLASRAEHTLHAQGQGAALIEARWGFDGQYVPEKLDVTAWNITEQKAVSASAPQTTGIGDGALNPTDLVPLNKSTWVIGSNVQMSQDELEKLSTGMLLRLHGAGVQGQFKLQGSNDYRLGQTLALSGFGKGFDGRGIITEVRHQIERAQWTTTISLGLRGGSSELTPIPAIQGLHTGVVAEFSSDEKNMARVRVELPILGKEPIWARMAMPYASRESGFHFYPDTGDEVVVGFFQEDPSCPVVLGSMYNPKNKPPVPLSKENNHKGFTLRRDDKALAVQFDEDEFSLTLCSDKDTVMLKDGIRMESPSGENGVVLIADKDTVTLKKGITVESKSGSAEVNIKGKKINLVNT